MGTSLGPKYIPYTYTDPLGKGASKNELEQFGSFGVSAGVSCISKDEDLTSRSQGKYPKTHT